MNTTPPTPTPDAVLQTLWDHDLDLAQAASALRLSLSSLALLLKQPGYAEPFDALHETARKCLDLRAARSITTTLTTLDAAAAKADTPAETRRISTAITKAANAAIRLSRSNAARPGATTRDSTARVARHRSAHASIQPDPALLPSRLIAPSPSHDARPLLAKLLKRPSTKLAQAGLATAAA
jgi:hypothetical protein